jgi:hypothetical protein
MSEPARQEALFAAAEVVHVPPPSPDFAGITFHEMRARTLLDRMPGATPAGTSRSRHPVTRGRAAPRGGFPVASRGGSRP